MTNMRSKEELLKTLHPKEEGIEYEHDSAAVIAEVLIDIRDILHTRIKG